MKTQNCSLNLNRIHYCSLNCKFDKKQCDLCRMQYKKIQESIERQLGIATLKFQPFTSLVKK